jgi:L-ribulose-5-phosphate 3-epimerase
VDETGRSGVAVRSICADYFMEAPLHVADEAAASQSMAVLDTLMANAAKVGVRDIVIPCVDQSSLRQDDDKTRLVERLSSAAPAAAQLGINLSLETDLAPGDFASLLDRLPFSNVTVNYDTGNSASLGFDVTEEFSAYGARISDIHIKDRARNGGSVVLGTGNTDFPAFLDALERQNYSGPIIMQAFRDDEGVEIFKAQMDWVKRELGSRLPVDFG